MSENLKDILTRSVSGIINKEHLEKELQSGKKLRIKFWIDPTAPIIHIGHAVPILKLRAFQKMGHQIILIIGDSTAQVGDTSDKKAERPMLTREETRKNAENYLQKFSKILDIEKVEVRFNSEWMDTTSFNMVWELAKNFSVAEMLDRDNFSKRFKWGKRISLQEFLYPIMQWYDSVMVKADVELGGNDQYFNILAGRKLQDAHKMKKQDIMTFHLLEGLDGRKMSKTYKNFISIDEAPNDMFVKIMEVKDELIIKYFEFCTEISLKEVKKYENALRNGTHPRDIKLILAEIIVTLYYDEKIAKESKKYFLETISKWEIPEEKNISIYKIKEPLPLVTVIRKIKFTNNSTEARNALKSNGVKINNKYISDPKYIINPKQKILIQVGKKKFGYIKYKS